MASKRIEHQQGGRARGVFAPGLRRRLFFGAVALDEPVIDWSGNCGNLTLAVRPFAIAKGLMIAPADGTATVRIWQANIQKKIVAHVPMKHGDVQEEGNFELDGVTFPAAEIRLEFLDPGGPRRGRWGRRKVPFGCTCPLAGGDLTDASVARAPCKRGAQSHSGEPPRGPP